MGKLFFDLEILFIDAVVFLIDLVDLLHRVRILAFGHSVPGSSNIFSVLRIGDFLFLFFESLFPISVV